MSWTNIYSLNALRLVKIYHMTCSIQSECCIISELLCYSKIWFLKYFQYEPDKVFLLKKLLIDTLTMDVALLKCKLLVWSQKKQTCQTSIFKRGPSPGSFCLFSFFSNTILQKTVGFSGIRTRIVRVEGEQAHHLTTVTAPRVVFIQ